MKQKNIRKKSGFSLIEILLVLALLGLVVSILGRRLFSQFGRGQADATRIAIKQLEGDLDRYRLDCNRYPTTEQGLKAMIEAPTTPPLCPNYDPSGYLGDGKKKQPVDAWQQEFLYESADGLSYTITSLGSDGVEGGEGDKADIKSGQ